MNVRQIQKVLKLRGLEIRPDALQAIISVLKGEENAQTALERLVTTLKEILTQQQNSSCIVDRKLVTEAVLDLSKNDEDILYESIKIWDAFKIPHSSYNSSTRSFQIENNNNPKLHSNAMSKTNFLRERFSFVQQRVLRDPMFSPRLAGTFHSSDNNNDDIIVLTPIEALAAGGGDMNQVHHVIGVLTRIDDDRLWLEDLTGKVPLELRDDVITGQGLFTIGCVVIAVGHLLSSSDLMEIDGDDEEDNDDQNYRNSTKKLQSIFRVTALMMPPKESRKLSEQAHPGCSRKLLGLPNLNAKEMKTIKEMEEHSDDNFFIFLSEIYLDDFDTMKSLRMLFEGFTDYPPQLFVLMGNFSRKPFSGTASASGNQINLKEFGDLFESLGNLMCEFPALLTPQTRWVFIPGQRDPSPTPKEILPRPCIPKMICEKLINKLPETCRVSFTSNPTRILFYSKELCFFRNDTMLKMRRNCVIPPTTGNSSNASEYLVRTLCDQGHLCPMSLDSRPIYTGYESSLRLFPLPNVVILADHYEQYQWQYEECQWLNPGSFSSDGSFVVYRPTMELTEFSRVDRGRREEQQE